MRAQSTFGQGASAARGKKRARAETSAARLPREAEPAAEDPMFVQPVFVVAEFASDEESEADAELEWVDAESERGAQSGGARRPRLPVEESRAAPPAPCVGRVKAYHRTHYVG